MVDAVIRGKQLTRSIMTDTVKVWLDDSHSTNAVRCNRSFTDVLHRMTLVLALFITLSAIAASMHWPTAGRLVE